MNGKKEKKEGKEEKEVVVEGAERAERRGEKNREIQEGEEGYGDMANKILQDAGGLLDTIRELTGEGIMEMKDKVIERVVEMISTANKLAAEGIRLEREMIKMEREGIRREIERGKEERKEGERVKERKLEKEREKEWKLRLEREEKRRKELEKKCMEMDIEIKVKRVKEQELEWRLEREIERRKDLEKKMERAEWRLEREIERRRELEKKMDVLSKEGKDRKEDKEKERELRERKEAKESGIESGEERKGKSERRIEDERDEEIKETRIEGRVVVVGSEGWKMPGKLSRSETKRDPMVMISGVEEGIGEEEIREGMGKWTGVEISKGDIMIMRRMKCRKWRWKENLVVKLTPGIFKIAMSRGRIEIRNRELYVEEYIDLVTCFRCCRHGHVGRYCREEARCYDCAGDHEGKDCPGGERRCANCVRVGKSDVDHGARDMGCPMARALMEKVREDTRYE